MIAALEADADRMRRRLVAGEVDPAAFRAALIRVPTIERDGWIDRVLQLGELPDDDPALPRGCVPYLPSDADVLLRALDAVGLGPDDVFVDVGAGLGRALLVARFATGAEAIGIEVQPTLVRRARDICAGLGVERVSLVEGDAAQLIGRITRGTVFFFYCPFSGARLAAALAELEPLARAHPIRICAVDLPLPPLPWLTPIHHDDRVLIGHSAP